MARAFGATPHADVVHAFDAENRQHTFVESLSYDELRAAPEGAPTFVKKYEMRISVEELLTVLDALSFVGRVATYRPPPDADPLPARQLRIKILATLGLVEEG